MKNILHLKKEEQTVMLFNGISLKENKPIPFPHEEGTSSYSSLFYWAHAEAFEDAEIPLHPHKGFEILTFVLKGSGEHYDTATKVWTPLNKGDVQIIQSGSGVQHSERIRKDTEAFQIWFDPNFSNSLLEDATYKDYKASEFKSRNNKGIEETIYLGENGVISHDTPNISIRKLTFTQGSYEEELQSDYTYSFYLLSGEMVIDGLRVKKDDFLRIDSQSTISYIVNNEAELFVIKCLTDVGYTTYMDGVR